MALTTPSQPRQVPRPLSSMSTETFIPGDFVMSRPVSTASSKRTSKASRPAFQRSKRASSRPADNANTSKMTNPSLSSSEQLLQRVLGPLDDNEARQQQIVDRLLGQTDDLDVNALLEDIDIEVNLLSDCLHELSHRMGSIAPQEGRYLTRIKARVEAAFAAVPVAVNLLKDEIAAATSLNKHLVGKLDEFKAEVATSANTLRRLQQDAFMAAFQARMQQNMALDDDVPEDYVQPPKDASHELKDLYELQRKRLQDEIISLRKERDTWLNASMGLCDILSDRRSMTMLKMLRLHQRTWYNSAVHYAIVVRNGSTQALDRLREVVQEWKRSIGISRRQLTKDDEACRAAFKVKLSRVVCQCSCEDDCSADTVHALANSVGRACRELQIRSRPYAQPHPALYCGAPPPARLLLVCGPRRPQRAWLQQRVRLGICEMCWQMPRR
eukprot:TRINITY_DN12590_c0_g1_i21.p2 TRINITY_DN12590_c0_g1~~TRINITY_DN12590_c0_g1_i21.p2  ORF type:complete len:488 (+),score=40.29 TRINITY_DN12590_c0_g1_i21:142-1464(+)